MNSHMARRIFVGLVLIAIGILFLASQWGIITIDPVEAAATYWPVLLIVYGLSGLIGRLSYSGERNSTYLWHVLILGLGVVFLAKNLQLSFMAHVSVSDFIKLLLPVFIIFIGIRMMFKSNSSAQKKQDSYYEYQYEFNQNQQTDADLQSTFGRSEPPLMESAAGSYDSSKIENRSGFVGDLYLGHDQWELKPMNISHFIGDTIIDLTKAQIPTGETKLNISAFIGDVKIFVPNDLEVELSVSSSSFLGDSTIFNKRESGFLRSMKEETHQFGLADKKIRLQISLFIGDIIVQRVG